MQNLTLQRSHPEYSHIELEWTSAQSTQPAICFPIIHVSILSSIISKQRNESPLLFRAQKQRSTCSKSKRTTEAVDRVQITRRKNLERAIDGFAQIPITRNNQYVSFGAWASTTRSSECYESSLKQNKKKSTSDREKKKRTWQPKRCVIDLRDKTTATTTVLFTWKINLTGNKKYNSFDAGALQEEEAAIVTKGSFDEYKKEDIRGGKKKSLRNSPSAA